MEKIAFLLFCLVLAGCDPSVDEIKKGQNIDIERMKGTIVEKSLKYYVGDNGHSDKKGQPYYILKISVVNGTSTQEEVFNGVPLNVFDAVEVGDTLPKASLKSVQDLAKMSGRIIDRQADFSGPRFSIVVDDGVKKFILRVDINTYYAIDNGQTLPFVLK